MLFSLSSLVLTLLPLAFGRVTDLSAADAIQGGQNFTAVLQTSGYIQNWDDFGVIWGLRPDSLNTCQECLGVELSYNDLYSDPTFPKSHGNASFSVPIPEGINPGAWTLVAAIPYFVGASGETGIRYFNHTVTVT